MVTPKLPPITVSPVRLPADKLVPIAARILMRRRSLGLSQAALAKRAGIGQQIVCRFETAARTNPQGLERIANALGVGVYWLVHGSPRPSVSILARPAGSALRVVEPPKEKGPSEEGP